MQGSGTEAVLQPIPVGDLKGTFFVPSYQRGYRWGAEEVRLLLDDIWASSGSPYYLQPVVVKKDGDRWELIDGQQRLTTLFLVQRYMERSGLQSVGPAYDLEYETRSESRAYLDDPSPDLQHKNIDFFHIYQAYECIRAWFEAHEHRKQFVANTIYGYLFESVRVIWYEVPSAEDSITLFTRLNVGRIPLTNAELVKALLLTNAGERESEMAAQWDSVERDLRAPDLWAFASGRSDPEPTHISLLLDTLADRWCSACAEGRHGASRRERPKFHTFEVFRNRLATHGATGLWDQVVALHAQVLGWFEDPDAYHRVGYLVATGDQLEALVRLADGVPKSEFREQLDDRVRLRLGLTLSDLEGLIYDDHEKCERALLLMNVQTVAGRTGGRFEFKEHVGRRWTLEHIHAQSADDLTRADQWREWLRSHREALRALPDVDGPVRDDLLARIEAALRDVTQHKFRVLEAELAPLFRGTGEDDVHAISNLALLSGEVNTALSNSVFEVKRSEILRQDRTGAYIPPATRNVFLKYYAGADALHIHFWGAADRASYMSAMTEALRPYLAEEEQA